MANNFRFHIGLIGGAAGDLDLIDGDLLADGDGAIVNVNGTAYSYHLDATSGAAESSPDVISPDTNAGTKRWILQALVSGHVPYILVLDEKDDGIGSGTFTEDQWQKRVCIEDTDTHNLCSVTDSVITLQPGTYDCYISANTYDCRRHRLRLQNTSDGVTVATGACNYSTDSYNGGGQGVCQGRFTITSVKNFEVQHYCTFTKVSSGCGLSMTGTGDPEIYLFGEFKRVG